MPATSKNCLLTVVTVSHLHWAKVWSDRARAADPESDVLVFVLDSSRDAVAHLPFAPGVRLMGAEDLPDSALQQARRYFNGMEFCCAAKSFALEHALFELGYANAVFLDSDTYSNARLDEVWQALEKHSMALTPHVASPFPEDGQSPDEADMLQRGFVNGGFWAARRDDDARRLLEWMKVRSIHRGFCVPSIGMFVDQGWLSCLPWLFPESVTLLRHPGLNVAYWNLHERQLTAEKGVLTSNGEPLAFFHYSGFNPATPDLLTQHPSRTVTDENLRALRPLMEEYAQRRQAAKASLPPITADFPCSQKNLLRRFRDYRGVHGAFPKFAGRALLGHFAERLAGRW